MNIKELHKIISDEKKEVIKKSELAKALQFSREYIGQLFKTDNKQIALDRIELASKYFDIDIKKLTNFQNEGHASEITQSNLLNTIKQFYSIDENDMHTVEKFLNSGNFRSLVKILHGALEGDQQKVDAVINILNVSELRKTFIE
ncbi:MAG: hypothetical protein BHW55_07915 [Candidatus Melainabacteria bacterium 35_41]|nr:MAG: hypothetical protein BHW55_07915 [Candidatus Melainabacteria bacterium 35_41]